MAYISPKLSLSDLLGKAYTDAVVAANEALSLLPPGEARRLADEKIDFYPLSLQEKADSLLSEIGKQIVPPFENGEDGAPTDSFRKAMHKSSAPVAGFGPYRVGEDGRLYLIGKSEHYHASLGHRFPGYRLIDAARALGVPNATHNNTRGYVTRLLEKRLIQSANGLSWSDEAGFRSLVSSREEHLLNRVINLETGSLAVEAGVKMMLARFYRLDPTYPAPPYEGKIPVFFVMADREGGRAGNYHGTTVLTQTFRGLWPGFAAGIEKAGLYRVVPVGINDERDFEEKIRLYNEGPYKTAGFLHELVLMNYGAIRLTEEFLRKAYALCRETDTPTLVDEIQSCMWYDDFFLFRHYGLRPDFAVIGKGFPGGEYPASKILAAAPMDNLNQFGALVTNGQEELASLAYLITMTYMKENGKRVERAASLFREALEEARKAHPDTLLRVEGAGHLVGLHFADVGKAAAFAGKLNERAVDASTQLYKADCPPAVLLKPPVTSSEKALETLALLIADLL